jgi:hypothetical protein
LPEPLIPAEYAYTLGACFGVAILETKYRPYVVQNFEWFLGRENYFSLLMKWCPEKVVTLAKDATSTQRTIQTKLKAENQNAQRDWGVQQRLMDELVTHCKGVKTTN